VIITINGRAISPDHSPYIIAELSANHNGSLERALKTIEAAHKCGVDAIKIQTYTADTLTIDCDAPDFIIKGGLWDGFKLYDLYKWAETPYEWHRPMFDHARKLGITIFSTPFDETAVDLLEDLGTPAYKIASFELVDLPLISYAASTGKPMIISTGMASEEEIEEAVTTAHEAGCKDLILLHCISSYPAPIDQANLRQIPELARRFGVISGLSDHTMGRTAAVTAVALGACVIEKHFTLNRKDKGPDSEFSIEPKYMERLCKEAKDAWIALGSSGYKQKNAEEKSKIFRRSIYFVRKIPAGSVITKNDIRRIRPGMGLAPKFFNTLIGKKLKKDVDIGIATTFEFFEEM
jgi:N-acetylneuraminate synthase